MNVSIEVRYHLGLGAHLIFFLKAFLHLLVRSEIFLIGWILQFVLHEVGPQYRRHLWLGHLFSSLGADDPGQLVGDVLEGHL